MDDHSVAVEVEVIAADFFDQFVERHVPAIQSEVTIREYGEPEISHTSSPSFDANEAENGLFLFLVRSEN
jgi:hypothetical protein